MSILKWSELNTLAVRARLPGERGGVSWWWRKDPPRALVNRRVPVQTTGMQEAQMRRTKVGDLDGESQKPHTPPLEIGYEIGYVPDFPHSRMLSRQHKSVCYRVAAA